MKEYTIESASAELLRIVNGEESGYVTPALDYLNSNGYSLDKDIEGKFFICECPRTIIQND